MSEYHRQVVVDNLHRLRQAVAEIPGYDIEDLDRRNRVLEVARGLVDEIAVFPGVDTSSF